MTKFVIIARHLTASSATYSTARLHENIAFSRDFYSRKLVKIPTQELYVFCNGPQDAPVKQEMKLLTRPWQSVIKRTWRTESESAWKIRRA